jgi:hypothetical protein
VLRLKMSQMPGVWSVPCARAVWERKEKIISPERWLIEGTMAESKAPLAVLRMNVYIIKTKATQTHQAGHDSHHGEQQH